VLEYLFDNKPMGATVSSRPASLGEPGGRVRPDGLVALLEDGAVRPGRELGPGGGVLPDAGLLPVLPVLRDLLPMGALQRGSVVAASGWNLLCLALAAGPVAAGAWCAVGGVAEFGVVAAADAGLDLGRLLLVPELGPNWPQVVASLLDGCDLVLLRPPDRPSAQAPARTPQARQSASTALRLARAKLDAQRAVVDSIIDSASAALSAHAAPPTLPG